VAPIKRFFFELFHSFFRYYNFPTALGLHRIGNPGPDSPVFVSGNYTLTVQRLLEKLKGFDCYLLVANSRGCNVWCAVGMNEYSEFDIIDAVTVADLKEVVRHRRLILPVYAAPGIDVEAVKRVTGFHVHWGPTHLNHLPEYIRNGLKRSEKMFKVEFGFQDRMEQALATGLAYAMTIGLAAIVWPMFILKVISLIFVAYLIAFGFYHMFPLERHWRRFGVQAAIALSAEAAWGLSHGWKPVDYALWSVVLIAILILVALDQCGSTPLYKTSLAHWLKKGDYLSLFNPVVDPELCTNCMQCVLVCPRYVFAARREGERKVVAVHPNDCEECLACVKQCPTDAIFNRSGLYKGDVKSIPNLESLVARDWTHLKGEDRWIGAPIQIQNGIPVVIESAFGSPHRDRRAPAAQRATA
jgi:NAD-dependent dihydropyrimidine dehydrogenase PreA subunit